MNTSEVPVLERRLAAVSEKTGLPPKYFTDAAKTAWPDDCTPPREQRLDYALQAILGQGWTSPGKRLRKTFTSFVANFDDECGQTPAWLAEKYKINTATARRW